MLPAPSTTPHCFSRSGKANLIMFRLPLRRAMLVGIVMLALTTLLGLLQFAAAQAGDDESAVLATSSPEKPAPPEKTVSSAETPVNEVAHVQQEPQADERGTFLFVELGKWSNQMLSSDFHGYEGNNLKPLPRGKQIFAGIPFYIGEGMVQLAGKRAPQRPESVEGIPIGRNCTHIHLFHGTGWGSPGVADGTVLGHYTVHYEDETSEQIPIVYGEDVRDWWQLADSAGASRATVAWTGVNKASQDFRGGRVELRLFLRTWENPKPRIKIDSLDMVSLNTTVSSPFCVAITLENRPDEDDAIRTLQQRNGYVEMGDDGHAVAVTLSTRRATGETLSLLSHLPNLQRVDLSNNHLDKAEWQLLSGLSGVRALSLNRTNADDATLALLTKWSRLEQLWLYDTRVTDAGLEQIRSLTGLKELDLSETRVSDAGIGKLGALEHLKKLDLRQTRVTEGGAERLGQKLPTCAIKF
jgi:hypothetical protein